MNADDKQLILGALDSLATALSQHGHRWSEGERAIYEQATTALGRHSTLGDDDTPGEEWKK